jgi:hypothetical protein
MDKTGNIKGDGEREYQKLRREITIYAHYY